MIKLVLLNIQELQGLGVREFWVKHMDSQRIEKMERCKNKDDYLRSLGAGIVVSFMESALKHENSRIYHSISHSGNYSAAVFSDANIGMDLQEMRRVEYLRISQRFFSAAQNRSILSLETPKEQIELFYEYWTCKEAEYKYGKEKVNCFFISRLFSNYTCSIASECPEMTEVFILHPDKNGGILKKAEGITWRTANENI